MELTKSKKAEKLKKEVLLKAQPVKMFFLSCIEKCPEEAGARIGTAEVHRNFLVWAEKQEIDVLKFSGKRAFREEFIRILEFYGCNTKIVENNSREHYKNIKMKKSFVDKMYC